MAGESIRTSRQLWDALQESAGLTLSGDSDAYDNQILAELRSGLVGGLPGDLGSLLEARNIPIERLLEQFLRAVAPFGRMMSDVLAMFEQAAARRSDRNLRLSLDVEGLEAKLDFDLSHFRETVERVSRTMAMVRYRDWDQSGWTIPQTFRESGLGRRLQQDRGLGDLRPPDPSIDAWLEAMDSGHSYPPLPEAPRSGNERFDRLAASVWADLDSFQAAARELFGSYAKIGSAKVPEEFQGWSSSLLRASHDYWPREIVRVVAMLGASIAADPGDSDANELLEALEAHLEAITSPPVPAEILRSELEDLFNLPVWKKRHELYSVWVAAVITRTLRPYGISFHPDGDTLRFPFRPTHVATIGPPHAPAVELWSELRSPASVNLKGRVGAVQPDYRIRLESREGPGKGADILIIECKQYRRSSTRNFSEALGDYAAAVPEAKVVLANYGPVGPAVMKAVLKDVADRCEAIGHVRPNGAGLMPFQSRIAGMAELQFGRPPAEHWLQRQIEVSLWWEGSVDLDLHITTPTGACGFATPDGLPEVSFGGDDRGISTKLHSEQALIRPATSERFDIVVQTFSGAERIPDGLWAYVRIDWIDGEPPSPGSHFRIVHLDKGNAKDWHVATFFRGYAEPLLPDCPAGGFRVGAGWSPKDGAAEGRPGFALRRL